MAIINTRSPLLALALVAPTLMAAPCGGDLFMDASFDLWCGNELCGWTVEEGEIAKVATWHGDDHGVGLVSDPVVLSQLAELTEADASCIWLSLLADQDDAVDLTLELDFMDDGVVDFEHRITVTDYAKATTQVLAPERYDGLRVRLRKVGSGEAVVAQIRAQRTDPEDCTGDPLPTRGLPLGSECTDETECSDGFCSETSVLGSDAQDFSLVTCGGCDTDADCGSDEVCGVSWGEGLFPGKTCLEPGTKVLGEACTGDTECGTGICHEAQCAECREDADCGGETCAPNPTGGSAPEGLSPWMCPVGEREPEAACIADADCASEACRAQDNETVDLCDPNGEPCAEDADCTWVDWGATCETVGWRAGTCL